MHLGASAIGTMCHFWRKAEREKERERDRESKIMATISTFVHYSLCTDIIEDVDLCITIARIAENTANFEVFGSISMRLIFDS